MFKVSSNQIKELSMLLLDEDTSFLHSLVLICPLVSEEMIKMSKAYGKKDGWTDRQWTPK